MTRTATAYTILIEQRARRLAMRLSFALFSTAMLLVLLCAVPAQALERNAGGVRHDTGREKISRDLQMELASMPAGRQSWTRMLQGQEHVQLIVTSSSHDAQLKDLRAQVLRMGGSVHAAHPIARGLTVQLPARRVAELAARDDVASSHPTARYAAAPARLSQLRRADAE